MSRAAVQPKIVVLAINSDGVPEFFQVCPDCTQEQVDSKEHLSMAKENAGFNGFSEPMIAFDADDLAGQQMAEALTWL
jgi:hypothetical protein